ncbi:MAG: DegV family protein [Bacillota bacterium]|jgi:DegV family protein with EDD domain
MPKVKIVTDSAQDFPPELLEKEGISVVPLTVFFGDEAFLDGYEIRGKAFYDKLRTSPHHPHTSQPSPEAFRAKFDELTKDGSPVVAILLSQVLSGTYQSAVLARDMLPDRNIEIVNSKLASCAYGVLARLAAEMADKGAGPSEIVSKVTEMAERTVTVFSVDTLDYLAKNGRIGKAQHFLGGLLNLKPILSLDKDGYVTAIERVRGKGKVLSRVMEILAERIPSKRLLAVSISHSDAPEEALKVKEAIQSQYKLGRLYESEIGAIIGTHVGPGTICVQAIPE